MLAQKGPTGSVRFLRCESNSAQQARILNAADTAMKLRVQTPLHDGEPVEVELAPGFSEKGRILYCRKQRDGFDVVVELHKEEQRREVRASGSQPGLLCELEIEPDRAIPAEVINLSNSGVGIVTATPLRVGSLVSLATATFYLIGEVRHSSPNRFGNAYQSGVRTERLTIRRDNDDSQSTMDSGKKTLPGASLSRFLQKLKYLLAI